MLSMLLGGILYGLNQIRQDNANADAVAVMLEDDEEIVKWSHCNLTDTVAVMLEDDSHTRPDEQASLPY